jgi:serine phosphatase RsbU (regulator of sigma subunit)/putative methionine-R-sulfoxide reductase with GAF domain
MTPPTNSMTDDRRQGLSERRTDDGQPGEGGEVALLTPHLQELEALSTVGRMIALAQGDVDALCELIDREVRRVVETDTFQIGLFEGTHYRILIWRVRGERRAPAAFPLSPSDGLVNWVRRTHQPLLVRDFEREAAILPTRPSYQSEAPPRSGLFVPLLAADQAIGLIAVQSDRPNAYSEDDLRRLSILANQVAVAIQNARLYRQAQARAAGLELVAQVGRQIAALLHRDELFAQVVHLVQSTFGYYGVSLFTSEPDGSLVLQAHTSPEAPCGGPGLQLGQGIIGTAAQLGEPVRADDVSADPRFIYDAALPHTRSEVAVPLKIEDRVLGVLDVQSDRVAGFSDEDVAILRTLADQIAIAIHEHTVYQAERRRARQLATIAQVTRAITSILDLDTLLDQVVRRISATFGYPHVGIYLVEPGPGEGGAQVVWRASTGLQMPGLSDPLEAPGIIPWVARTGESALVADVTQDARYVVGPGQEDTRSELAVPLRMAGQTLGVLDVQSNRVAAFGEEDRFVLQTLGDAIAVAVRNARLVSVTRQESAARARLERELEVGREIQLSFLPDVFPQVPGWELAAYWQAAHQVGGDFYDYIPLGRDLPGQPLLLSGPCGLAVADVADKGVPAALFMALLRTLIRAVAIPGRRSPARVLERVNDLLLADARSDVFATVVYVQWDPDQATITYANAGHNPPLLIRANGQVKLLRVHGLALGVLPHIHLDERSLRLEPGDVLVLYTDGLTEALNAAQEEFGLQRLQQTLLAARSQPAAGIIQAVTQALSDFCGEAPPFDDQALLILKRE